MDETSLDSIEHLRFRFEGMWAANLAYAAHLEDAAIVSASHSGTVSGRSLHPTKRLFIGGVATPLSKIKFPCCMEIVPRVLTQ